MKKIVYTDKAPEAVGPYSQAVASNGLLCISGQLPIDPQTGSFVSDDVVDQVRQCLANLQAILTAGGSTVDNVLKTTIYLKRIEDFGLVNEEYAKVFGQSLPARAAFEVANLPKGALVEIEALAAV
ncbi:MAG: Rid family detoxifying hydrolase [Spirochaetota bacterium]